MKKESSAAARRFLPAVLLLCFISVAFSSAAADRYWVASGAASWNNAANWSATSGGPGGASVPGQWDRALFDGGGHGSCSLDMDVKVAGLQLGTGYWGTFVQGAYALLVGSNGMNLAGAGFQGGSARIRVEGPFVLSGTAFTSTSDTLIVGSGYGLSFTGGTFAHNNGTVQVDVFNNTVAGNFTFNNLVFHNTFGPYTCTIASGTVLTVNGTLHYTGNATSWINTGTIDVKGNIRVTCTSGNGGGNALLRINGTGVQTIEGAAGSEPNRLPQVVINKPSGQLHLAGTIGVANHWTYTAGTIDPGTARMLFAGNLTITGAQTFYDLEFNAVFGNYITTIASGTELTVTNNLYISGTSGMQLNTGTIRALRDIIVTNSSPFGAGTATVLISGTTDQTLTGSGISNTGRLPRVTIHKTSGTLHLLSIISVGNNWSYVSGTVNPGTSRVVFAGDMTISGTLTFHEVDFSALGFTAGTYITIAGGTTLTVPGHLYISGGNIVVQLNTGTVEALNDITITNLSMWSGGTALVWIHGTGNQTLTGSGESHKGNLPRTRIEKPSGTLQLASIISASGDWTYVTGTIDPGTSRVAYNNWLTVSGTHTLHDVEVGTLTNSYQ
ncbi:MAG TPA: hypothetical protein VHK69_09075, partial [Chitinophagaceae bacterium]|nr:hypothetical protein [Chitinophagaceae bacterium]